MILQANGLPFPTEELVRRDRPGCPGCGSIEERQVTYGFGKHWRMSCRRCGYEFARGRGEMPEGRT